VIGNVPDIGGGGLGGGKCRRHEVLRLRKKVAPRA
jgi:hypothetical protein